jgi:RimJ/RimL family protein N-acetyltransferase
MLESPRLILRPATAAMLHAELDDRTRLAELLGVRVPENWPPETLVDALPYFLEQVEGAPELAGWLMWYVVLKDDAGQGPVLVGSTGFTGPVGAGRSVETGYSVLPQYQNRGYATEAVGRLIGWAFSHPEVASVVAQTALEPNPSVRVLTKLGFRCVGEGEEFGTLRFELVRPEV